MNTSTVIQNQLLVTKFYVPMAPRNLISRPRLSNLLDKSLKHPFTLVSAPAGFGKTTLLSTWAQSLPARHPLVAWVSLDEEDNEPRLFWTYVLSALDQQQPERFQPLLTRLQSQPPPPLKSLVTALVNLLGESTQHFVLILDDYQMITEEQIHTTLGYLVEHLPAQLRIIISTRADSPLPLSLLRARNTVLEVRTDQLRCTTEETEVFFHQVIGIDLPDEIIQEVTARTEGWLVGLQLLGLSLPEQANPLTLLEEVAGNQHYILDYLTEEVLRRQPPEVQTFLLSTCILEQLTASLCDSVLEQAGSQKMLERLEQANLFVVPLDSKRQWYRYHALFAEALRHQLEQTDADLIPTLHHRASIWYAQHHQTIKVILHALHAHQWLWVAELIERTPPLFSYPWRAREQELAPLREHLEQLPAEIIGSRPRLCLICAHILGAVVPASKFEAWLEAAKATLTAALSRPIGEDTSHPILTPQEKQDQENLLGEVIACLAFQYSYQGRGQEALLLCQQALSLLSAQNFMVRTLVGHVEMLVYHTSAVNNVEISIESGVQATSLAQEAGATSLAIDIIGSTVLRMIHAGRLHQAYQLIQQAIQLGTQQEELLLPEMGWPSVFQAKILREWNELDRALSLAQEALSLCKQTASMGSLVYRLCGYAVLVRVLLSRGELDGAQTTLQEFERLCLKMSQLISSYHRAYFTTVDQVRLWLACGKLEQALLWVEQLDLEERHSNPFVREREEVACARVLLARNQPILALERLELVLQRATEGQRWGQVIEIWILQALAHQMRHEETLALSALSEALRLAQPEGYIRSFVDEGPPIAALLSRLQEEQRKDKPTPYLDILLAAFPQQSKAQEHQSKQAGKLSKMQPLLDPLSERELEVLQLIACGASNQEIAQQLVIALDTVKRHVSHIFSKLGVKNRVQAVRQARELSLLDEQF